MVDLSKLDDYSDTDELSDSIYGDDSVGTGVVTISETSILDKLKASIEEAEKDTVNYPVPEGRFPKLGASVELEFSKNITTQELNRFQKAAKAKRRGDEVDAGKASALILAAKSVAVWIGGKQLVDDDGEPITLRSEEMLSITGSHTAADGVRRLLGDGGTTSMSDSLIGDAGFGDSVDDAGNPTSRA